MGDTVLVDVRCASVSPISGAGRLLGLADAEIDMGGISLEIHGIQVYADARGTEVRLPKYRASSGEWLPAVSLPEEIKGPLGDVVIAAALEAGILQMRNPA